MARTYTITAVIPVYFTPAGCLETECADVCIDITYTCSKGAPERGPTYSHGGLPAEPPEVEFVSCVVTDGDGIELTQEDANNRATDWLLDTGYDDAVRNATETDVADADHFAEMRAEDRRLNQGED